jgi:hypothetical protein
MRAGGGEVDIVAAVAVTGVVVSGGDDDGDAERSRADWQASPNAVMDCAVQFHSGLSQLMISGCELPEKRGFQ